MNCWPFFTSRYMPLSNFKIDLTAFQPYLGKKRLSDPRKDDAFRSEFILNLPFI